MKRLRYLCLATMAYCLFMGVKIYLHAQEMPQWDSEPVVRELRSIEDRDRLLAKAEAVAAIVEKATERADYWRTETAYAWGFAALFLLWPLIATYVWNRENELEARIRELEAMLDAHAEHER